MKQRVAIIATLIVLAICLGFLGAAAAFGRAALNESALLQIKAICRLSAMQLDSAAFTHEEALTYLRQVAKETALVFTIYNGSGETVFTSRPDVSDSLQEEHFALLKPGAVETFQSGGLASLDDRLCALIHLSDGNFLCVSRSSYSLLAPLGRGRIWLFALAVLAAVIVLGLMNSANKRTDRLVKSVMQVLSDFSEGELDSRIVSSSGDSLEQVARFNEILGSIQARIFMQRTRNQALGSLLNQMQNGVLAVDQHLNVLLVTPAGRQLLGIVGSAVGTNITMCCKDVQLDDVLKQAMQQDHVYSTEVEARTGAGHAIRPIQLYISPMRDAGKVVGAVAMVEDVSEIRRLEKVRTDFAANVSHEMKTPLTSIKGFVETLQNGAINNPEMAQKFLRIIMLEADRLTRLINDILTVSKLESGKDAAPNERIRLDQMADDVSDMLRILASEKQVTITCTHGREPSIVSGNRDRVEQMLINLIENAIKYNKQGGSVTVSIYNNPETVDLSVADTGIGIPEENLSRIFERFYRVDKGRSRAMGGTGLGLSIVKHIVKSMGGMIEVHSKLGEGTEFLVTLLRAPISQDTQVEEQLNEPA